MAAGRLDLTIEQGSTFSLPIAIKNSDGSPFDLTGWTATGQIRKSHRSETVEASFSFTIDSPTTLGTMTIIISASVTASMDAGETETDQRSKYVYDIEITHSSQGTKRLLEGIVYVSPEVTRT